MKTDSTKFAMGRWSSAIALVLLASCGGGGDGGGSLGNVTTPGGATPGGAAPAAASASNTFVATLSGAQETPPNSSSATGNATATVDPATKAFSVSVTTSGIAGNAAHVHDGAPGVAGPIIFPLTESPAGSGNWSTSVTLTDAQLNLLVAGNYYVNVHSAAFPNGEIRGQLVAAQSAMPSGAGAGTSAGASTGAGTGSAGIMPTPY